MTSLLLAFCFLAAPDVQVRLTPDQPLPFAYVDEPLVVEVASPTLSEASVQVEVRGELGQPPVPVDLGKVNFSEKGTYWGPLHDVALQRDRYTANFTIAANGTAVRRQQSFCRIDRPVADQSFPLCATVEGSATEHLPLALTAIPGRAIRLHASAPDIEKQAAEAQANGVKVIVAFSLDRLEDPPTLAEHLAQSLGETVLRWEVDPGAKPEAIAPLAASLRRSQSRAPLGLLAADGASLSRLLTAGAGDHVSVLVLAQEAPGPAEIHDFRLAAERAGYEGMALVILNPGIRSNVTQPSERLNRQVLLNLAAGAESVVNGRLILDGTEFGPDFVKLSGMAHRLRDTQYVGNLDLDAGVNAPVMRAGEKWIIALSTDDGAREVTLPTAQTEGLVLTDSRNNVLPLPALSGDTLTLHVGPDPVYLSGRKGPILGDAARARASAEAGDLLTLKEAPKKLPPGLVALLKVIAQNGDGGLDRRGFLAMLGSFQAIEAAYQAGKLPRELAVPVTAGLGRLLRSLCIIEQERDEPFLEPLQDMVEKCAGYTSKYLASSSTGNGGYNRQDWLLGEVNRLVADAQQLQKAGRANEADAVAALAEARARALEFATPRQ